MASTLGLLGSRIISVAPIPAAAIPQLRIEFGDELSRNPHLDTDTRLEWITTVKGVSADIVSALCRHTFTIEQLNAILDVEKRRSPSMALLAEHDEDPAAVSAIVAHRNGHHVAEYLVGNPWFPQAELLVHIDKLKPQKRAALLAGLTPDEIDDDTIVEHLLTIEDGLSDVKRGTVGRHCTTMLALRPQLGPKLLAAGAPEVTITSLAQSPWLTSDDVAIICGLELSKYAQLAIAGNPWVDPEGPIRDALTEANAQYNLQRRLKRDVTRFHASAFELEGEELRSAVLRAMPSQYKANGRPELLLLLARNPNLTERDSHRVATQLDELTRMSHQPPLWALALAESAFGANYPELGNFVEGIGTPPDRMTYSPSSPRQEDPPDPEHVERAYTSTALRSLITTGAFADAVFGRFANELGDDPHAWVAAALLADSVDGTLDELAALASATS